MVRHCNLVPLIKLSPSRLAAFTRKDEEGVGFSRRSTEKGEVVKVVKAASVAVTADGRNN